MIRIYVTESWARAGLDPIKVPQKIFCFLALQKIFLFPPKNSGFQIFLKHYPMNNIIDHCLILTRNIGYSFFSFRTIQNGLGMVHL